MTTTKTYVELGWQPPPKVFLDDETYRKILPVWVKACVDVILYLTPEKGVSQEMVIAKRKIQPMMDWWIFGGRIFVTDTSLQDALVRKLQEEIGLSVDAKRIPSEPLRLQMYKWAPDNSVILAPAFCLEITPAEYEQMRKNLAQSPEYSDLTALSPRYISQQKDFHEALRDYAQSLGEYLAMNSE